MSFVPTSECEVTADWVQNDVLKGHIEGRFKVVNQKTQCMTKSDDRQGFLSLMVRTETDVEVEGEATQRRYHLFVKMYPPNQHHRSMVREMSAFDREIHTYTKLLQQIKDAQSVSDGQQTLEPNWAKCYYATTNPLTKTSVIVMQDLVASGYRLMNKKAGMDHEHLVCGMRAFAKTHALTYNLKCQTGIEKLLLNNVPLLDEPMKTLAEVIDMEYEVSVIRMRKMNQHVLADRMEAYVRKHPNGLFQRVLELLSPQGKMTTFVQGDCWINNMMVRHEVPEDINTKPLDVKLLDLQLFRYSPACTDLHYFLISSSYRAAREPYEELEKAYYDTFFDVLKQVGNPLSMKDYTFEEFHADFNYFREYGFIMGQLFIGGLLTEEQELPNLDQADRDPMDIFLVWVEEKKHEPVPKILGERLLELVKEMADFNVI